MIQTCAKCGEPMYVFNGDALCRNRACSEYNVLVDTPSQAALRALRVWHWRIAMNARRAAESYRDSGTVYSKRQARTCDRRADFHIKCVQALNDVVSGTAHDDDVRHVPSLGSKVK